jgi:hypothetical protein
MVEISWSEVPENSPLMQRAFHAQSAAVSSGEKLPARHA